VHDILIIQYVSRDVINVEALDRNVGVGGGGRGRGRGD